MSEQAIIAGVENPPLAPPGQRVNAPVDLLTGDAEPIRERAHTARLMSGFTIPGKEPRWVEPLRESVADMLPGVAARVLDRWRAAGAAESARHPHHAGSAEEVPAIFRGAS